MTVLSAAATAESYTVTVNLNSSIGETPLLTEQVQAMSYPELEVNEATLEGASCVASGRVNSHGFNGQVATNANSLCPGATGQASITEFTGVPNAFVSVDYNITAQESNGVRFSGSNGSPANGTVTRTLSNNEGKATLELHSSVRMYDKSLVNDAVMEFSYDIAAAYQ